MRVKRTMERVIDEWRPDVVCTIDYPGMNLRLAAYAKKRGIRTVHVVCPQVWAWHSGRIPKIEASLDKLCCFFPFEPALFRPGFAEFVGHPLADERFGTSAAERERGLVAILPGSRIGEIDRHLPTMLEAVRGIPGVRIAIPAANAVAKEEIYWIAAHENVEVLPRDEVRGLLERAQCAVVASGTATLEAALAGCPTVLVYKVGRLLAAFLRRAIKGIRHVGLANIVAEKSGAPCPMPELLQEDFTAGNVRSYVERWLGDTAEREKATAALSAAVSLLKPDGGALERIARAVEGTAAESGEKEAK